MNSSEQFAADVGVEKARLRNLILARRQSLDPAWTEAASRRLQERVVGLEAWAMARRVAVYLALRGEAGTALLVQDCRTRGVELALPARRALNGYGFVWWKAGEALEGGPLGTREPAVKRWLAPGEQLDVVIVPGLAYDKAGRRLGHGGGHYDRLLAAGGDAGSALKIGLAFGFQILERVPADERDQGVDWVITEEGVMCCSPGAARERRIQ